jgi:hypothetical protein
MRVPVIALVSAILLFTGRHAQAQQPAPIADVFAGYSLLPSNINDDFPRQTSHGFQGSVAVHANRWFAVVADGAVQWNTTSDLGPNFAGLTAHTRVTELLVGPRFTRRGSRVDAFAQGWFGSSTGHADEPFTGFADTGMTFGGGAGIDVRASSRMAVRIQYDLIGSFADMVEGNSRFATGLVWRFGR